MDICELDLPGVYRLSPTVHADERGTFLESYRADTMRQILGRSFVIAQTNTSTSRAGVVRGIHSCAVPPGQAKYVSCVAGSVLDVAVDLREGSPTFAQHVTVTLDDTTRQAVYIPEGFGHAFMALSPGATVNYLCSSAYNPAAEFGINPFDPELAIAWPTAGPDGSDITPLLSPKDTSAPGLDEARRAGLLPSYDAVQAMLDDAIADEEE